MAGHLAPAVGGIDYDLAFFQQRDQLLRLIGVEIDRADAAVGVHRSDDELEMVDLIHAVFDSFEGVHGGGDVAGDGHSALVGFGGDGFEDVGLYLGVDLDLFELCVGVEVDYGGGFGGVFDVDVAECEWTAAIDEAGEE